MLIDICIKFREYNLSGLSYRADTICDRQTDGLTDARGKTICLPSLKGENITRININDPQKKHRLRMVSKNNLL